MQGVFHGKIDLYKDIQQRAGGEIHTGTVGPVRTGKSDFARKFVESLVLSELADIGSQALTANNGGCEIRVARRPETFPGCTTDKSC